MDEHYESDEDQDGVADTEGVGDPEDFEQINFLTVEQVKELHEQGIYEFTPTESLYIRDQGLLESAVMAPQASWGGVYLHESLGAMAAALLYSLAQNHAFENGNKRVALSATSIFLRINGYRLILTQDEAKELTMNVAEHRWDKARVAQIIENGMEEL